MVYLPMLDFYGKYFYAIHGWYGIQNPRHSDQKYDIHPFKLALQWLASVSLAYQHCYNSFPNDKRLELTWLYIINMNQLPHHK